MGCKHDLNWPITGITRPYTPIKISQLTYGFLSNGRLKTTSQYFPYCLHLQDQKKKHRSDVGPKKQFVRFPSSINMACGNDVGDLAVSFVFFFFHKGMTALGLTEGHRNI